MDICRGNFMKGWDPLLPTLGLHGLTNNRDIFEINLFRKIKTLKSALVKISQAKTLI